MNNQQSNFDNCDLVDPTTSNLIQTGIVVKIERSFAVVKVGVSSACAGCHSKCTLAGEHAERLINIPLIPGHPYKKGESLRLEIDSRYVFSISFLIYFIPTLIFIIFAAIGWSIALHFRLPDSNIGALIGIAVAVPLIIIYLSIIQKRYSKINQIKVIPRSDVNG